MVATARLAARTSLRWIMQSDAIDVDSYLTQVPEGRRAVLTEIRDACRRLLAGFAESMSYGMPTYSRDGTAEIAWASQKRYCTSPCMSCAPMS